MMIPPRIMGKSEMHVDILIMHLKILNLHKKVLKSYSLLDFEEKVVLLQILFVTLHPQTI